MDRNKLDELKAIAILYDIRRRDLYNTDYLVFYHLLRRTLALDGWMCGSREEKRVFNRVKNCAYQHFEAVSDMRRRCKPTELACSGGFRGITTVCRCYKIHVEINSVVNTFRGTFQVLPEGALSPRSGVLPQVVGRYRSKKWKELNAINTLYGGLHSVHDTNYLDLANHIQTAQDLPSDYSDREDDRIYELEIDLYKTISDAHSEPADEMEKKCTSTNLACSGGQRGVLNVCHCKEIIEQIGNVLDAIRPPRDNNNVEGPLER